MDFIQENYKDIWVIVTSVVTISSVVARMTKSTWDDNFVAKMLRILSIAPKNPNA